MTRHHTLWGRTFGGLFLVVLAGGCAMTSPRSDFYTLNPVTAAEAHKAPPAATCRDVVVAIGPVTWPSYLDRPQIVTRLSANRISFDEFHRWAGSIEEDFERVLADNLSSRLHTDSVVSYPGKFGYKPRFRVLITVNQFDGRPGDAVTLNGTWSVMDEHSGEISAPHESVIREPASGPGYEAMVVAASASVGELSQQIATELSRSCALAGAK
jgi:uncharacterized lipoprotein YmbA